MQGMPKDIGPLHFIGIGGIGMSGIAEILNTLGYKVQGSDQADGANVKRLRDKGMTIHIGHEPSNITEGLAAVVISSAIKQDNPELTAAREAAIPVIRRAEMLAELMRMKWAIAIGGTHGKTTTTSMVGQMLDTAGFDPTVINGGIVNAYGTNVRLGQSDIMVVEADESDGTFTRLPASVAVITNMDAEHMDHYGSFDAVKDAYRTFIHNLPFYGYAVLCIDHPEVQALVPSVRDRKIITYGFNPQADLKLSNVRINAEGSTFDANLPDGTDLKDIFLPMLGEHNVQNALVAIAIAHEMGVPAATLKDGLAAFTGVKRRFTKTGISHGITIIDDYAHHPIEIETVLKTARSAVAQSGAKVIAVMQPHRYSRLDDLFEDFCKCFNDADTVIITDVYEAGETPIENRNKLSLVEGIKSHGHRNAHPLPSREELPHTIAKFAEEGDYVILMGAGDITSWAYELPEQLEAERAKRVA
ncbi:MAG: UDP-N-acetylmuramate--L-alanine ligase [Alphaproteobacteria bacterium]